MTENNKKQGRRWKNPNPPLCEIARLCLPRDAVVTHMRDITGLPDMHELVLASRQRYALDGRVQTRSTEIHRVGIIAVVDGDTIHIDAAAPIVGHLLNMVYLVYFDTQLGYVA